jgi:hypothetical protein
MTDYPRSGAPAGAGKAPGFPARPETPGTLEHASITRFSSGHLPLVGAPCSRGTVAGGASEIGCDGEGKE